MSELIASLSLLGVISGYLIAYSVPDETKWYPKYFRLAAAFFGFLAAFFFSAPITPGAVIFARLFLAGFFIFAVYKEKMLYVIISTFMILLSSDPNTWKLMLVALIPLSGALYSKGFRKEFLWFISIPILLILRVLLF